MSEARRFGIKIIKPNINKSYYEWRGYKDKIIMGFMSIKKLQKKAVSVILEERKAGPFDSLDNFLIRTELDLADAMVLTNAGCFNDLAFDHTHQEIAYKVAGYYLQNTNRTVLSGTPFKNQIATEDLFRLESESFGYPVSVHPISIYRPILSRRIIQARDISYHYGKIIYLMGVCITRKESITKKSQPMQFLTLEDETDIYECVLFPDTFKEFGDLLNWEKLFIIRGLVEKSFGVYSITIQKMASIKQWVKRSGQNNRMKYNC
jgi:error-prone DNA polymerase